jgi:hypothetical protein
MPLLRFQEVWIILHGDQFVADCLNYETKQVVQLTSNLTKAQRFTRHEDARSMAKTLCSVVGPGFNLRRMFKEN